MATNNGGSGFRFQLTFDALTQNATRAVRQFQSVFKDSAQQVQSSSAQMANATKAAEAAFGNLLNFEKSNGLALSIEKTVTATQRLQRSATAAAAQVATGFAPAEQAVRNLRGEVERTPASLDKFAGSARGAVTTLLQLVGVTAGLAGVAQAIRAVADAGVEFERVNQQLVFATGSVEQGARAYQFATGLAKEYALELNSLGKGYAQLAAATKGSRLEGSTTEELFKGIAQAAATLGLSVADTGGVITALGQIASKGTVSLEELRGQLGERVPGALSIAARSLGVTEQQLLKLVESGLDATTFLQAFGPELQRTFGGSAAKNVETLGGQITLLRNQLTQLFIDLSQSDAGAALRASLQGASDVLTQLVAQSKEFAQGADYAVLRAVLQSVLTSAQDLFKVFSALGTTIFESVDSAIQAAQGLVGAFTGLESSTERVNVLTSAVQGLGVIFGFITDGVRTLSIALDVVAGSFLRAGRDIANVLSAISFGDLSASFEQVAQTLETRAAQAFGRAEAAALNFKSAGVAALDATAVSAVRSAAETVKLAGSVDRLTERAAKLAPAARSALDALVDMGAAGVRASAGTTEATAKAVVELGKLASGAKVASSVLRQELGEAISGAKTSADIALLNTAIKSLSDTGKLTGADLQEVLNQVGDKARQVAQGVEGSMGATLQRLGVQTKAGLQAALQQAQVDLQRVQELAAQGVVGFDAVGKAQAALAAAQAAATPGAATLADVTKRLADVNAEYEAQVKAAAEAQAAATASQSASIVQTDTLTTAVAGLAGQWAATTQELLALSPAAAAAFGNDFGVQIQGVADSATDAASSIEAINRQLADIAANRVIADFTGLSGAAEEIAISSLKVKRAFFEQKQEADSLAESISNLSNSGTATIGQLEQAVASAGREFSLLDDNDLSNLRAAAAEAERQVAQLRREAQAAVDDFRELGDSIESELLRAKGLNEEAIKLDFNKRRNDIQERLNAAGSNPAARAEAERALSLLDELEKTRLDEERNRSAPRGGGSGGSSSGSGSGSGSGKTSPPSAPSLPAPGASNSSFANGSTASAAANVGGGAKGGVVLEFRAPDGSNASVTAPNDQGVDALLRVLEKSGAVSTKRAGATT